MNSVAYRNWTFTDITGLKRKVHDWAPTTSPAQEYVYSQGVKSMVAVNGEIASVMTPLMLFSHGTNANGLQSIYICEWLAASGVRVLAVDHKDMGKPHPSFVDPDAWDDTSCEWRRQDLAAVLDLIFDDRVSPNIFAWVDLESIGVFGHSLGGYAALGLVGGWPSWRDVRVTCALGLSPVSNMYVLNGGQVKAPVWLQGGSRDLGITPGLIGTMDWLRGPKRLEVIMGAGHLVWTNQTCVGQVSSEACVLNKTVAGDVVYFAQEFVDAYLRGK